MSKIFFFDLDGTLRQTKSGATFINDPDDQRPINGAREAVTYYASKGFTCIGITNQGGVSAGHKSLVSAVKEQRITLNLFPELAEIFFCPNWGESCYQVSRENEPLLFSSPDIRFSSCRKPNGGMIELACQGFTDLEIDKCWMSGDRPEDHQAAICRNIKFMPAEIMLAKFSPGKHEIKSSSWFQIDKTELLEFLAL